MSRAITATGVVLIAIAAERMRKLMEPNSEASHARVSEIEARNINAQRLIFASRAHCQLILLRNFRDSISECESGTDDDHDEAIVPMLRLLLVTLGLWFIEKHMGEFLAACSSPAAEDGCRTLFVDVGVQLDECLRSLRPDAVSIVDSFDLSDYELDSALGRYDGDVYQALYDRTQDDPINQSDLPPGYDEFLKPVIAGGMWTTRSSL